MELELESGIVHPYVHFKPFFFLRHMIYRIDRIRSVWVFECLGLTRLKHLQLKHANPEINSVNDVSKNTSREKSSPPAQIFDIISPSREAHCAAREHSPENGTEKCLSVWVFECLSSPRTYNPQLMTRPDPPGV